ncbi:hypothetical protein EXIGLDRAFT_722875, partial [Exidia glandulosa HHB12029]
RLFSHATCIFVTLGIQLWTSSVTCNGTLAIVVSRNPFSHGRHVVSFQDTAQPPQPTAAATCECGPLGQTPEF